VYAGNRGPGPAVCQRKTSTHASDVGGSAPGGTGAEWPQSRAAIRLTLRQAELTARIQKIAIKKSFMDVRSAVSGKIKAIGTSTSSKPSCNRENQNLGFLQAARVLTSARISKVVSLLKKAPPARI